jgi:hypothetical protein
MKLLFLKHLLISIGCLILIFVVGWIGFRRWVYYQETQLRAGITDYKTGNYQAAYQKIRPYAEAGNPLAQRTLGQMYAFGLGVRYDKIQATVWFRRSECAKKISGEGEYNAAFEYLSGYGGQNQDLVQAATWFQLAAEAGHPTAQKLLADKALLKEKGLSIDPLTSEYWRTVVERQKH